MKTKLLIIIFTTMLTGCAVLSMFQFKKFDSIQLLQLSTITVTASDMEQYCASTDVPELKKSLNLLSTQTKLFLEYSLNKENELESIIAAKNINNMVANFKTVLNDQDNKVSERFCLAKLANIQEASRTISKSIGQRNE